MLKIGSLIYFFYATIVCRITLENKVVLGEMFPLHPFELVSSMPTLSILNEIFEFVMLQ